jgi:hypothetical protein
MEIKSANDGLLTNVEVLSVLQERQLSREQRAKRDSKANAESGALSYIHELNVANYLETEVIKYVTSTAAGALPV